MTALMYGPSALNLRSQEYTGITNDGTRDVFTFETTPSALGVTRPNSYTVTLAEGRDYILIGAMFLDRTGSTDIYSNFQWFDVGSSVYVGHKASLVSGTGGTVSQASSHCDNFRFHLYLKSAKRHFGSRRVFDFHSWPRNQLTKSIRKHRYRLWRASNRPIDAFMRD